MDALAAEMPSIRTKRGVQENMHLRASKVVSLLLASKQNIELWQ